MHEGQCFCHPSLGHGECEHCNRARMYIARDVLVLANELAEEIDLDDVENLYSDPEDEDGDPYPRDIYQWYIVTDWLHGKLRDQGEPVAEWKGQCWWGRTCCGQSIELDGTMQAISRSLG